MSVLNSQPVPRASLLRVAPEIRLRIYQYVFDQSRIILDIACERTDDYGNIHLGQDMIMNSFENAVTQVSTMTRWESFLLLQASTILFIRSNTTLFDKDLELEFLPHGPLARLRRMVVDFDLVELLPVAELKSLEYINVTFGNLTLSHVTDDRLLEDNKASETTMHQLILKKVQKEIEESEIREGIAKFRQRVMSHANKVTLLWSGQTLPRDLSYDWCRVSET